MVICWNLIEVAKMAAVLIDKRDVEILSDVEINLILSNALRERRFVDGRSSLWLNVVQPAPRSYRSRVRMIAISLVIVMGATLGVSFVKSSSSHNSTQSGSPVHFNRNGVLVVSPVTVTHP